MLIHHSDNKAHRRADDAHLEIMSTFETDEHLRGASLSSIVLLDGRTMLRNECATLSNQQRKPSFKFGTSDEFGSVILLLSNKGVQLAGS